MEISQRNANLIKYREDNPCKNMAKIAKNFGICRERVRQILNKHHIRTTSVNYGKNKICLCCGKIKASWNKGLCIECFKKSKRIVVECSCGCGQFKEILASLAITYINKRGYNHFFYNKSHQGKWLSRNFGFAKYPENIRCNIKAKTAEKE